MKCILRFEADINTSKIDLQKHIKSVLGFSKKRGDLYTNRGSYFTTNPNSISIEIDTSSYPLILISGKCCLLSKSFLNKIIKDWYLSHFSENSKIKDQSVMIFTSIESFSFNKIAILLSRYLFPVCGVFLISLLTFVSMTHEVMLGVYQEILNDLNNPGKFNVDRSRIRPMFFEVYSKSDMWFGSLLFSLLGGGFPFALKNLFCLLVIRNSIFLSKRPLLPLFLFFIFISFILTPKSGEIIFSLILGAGIICNYFLFNILLRNQPYFIKKLN